MITNNDYIAQQMHSKELMCYLGVVDNVEFGVITPILNKVFRWSLNVGNNSTDRFQPITDSFREYYF